MINSPLPRLDQHDDLRTRLLRYCRLGTGELWVDSEKDHRVACLDAADGQSTGILVSDGMAQIAIQDPPYNQVAFETTGVDEYISWCKRWLDSTERALCTDSSLYVWMGADQRNGFQPLPEFMLMMRSRPFRSRSLITLRNQRGYGTQKNWMAIRQELLYYVRGEPTFDVSAEYTAIPRILRGYYKVVKQRRSENLERSKSENIRAGNVWVDIQQVFYRVAENVNGCYAQKPLKAYERIIGASSRPGDLIVDFFGHSGTTLIAAEMLGRRCALADRDPVYCEIAIRRLENFRRTGRPGWQNGNPFETEFASDPELKAFAG